MQPSDSSSVTFLQKAECFLKNRLILIILATADMQRYWHEDAALANDGKKMVQQIKV